MANCQSCGKEIGEDEICEACSNAQQPVSAVSAKKPIVAVIAIIAIVAVIAVVILLMFAGGSDSPDGSMASMTATSSTTAKLTFGTFSPVPELIDIKVILTPETGTAIEYWFAAPPETATTTLEATTGTAVHVEIAYDGANALNCGEYFDITGLEPGMAYTISVFHYPTDGFCSLTGDVTFTMPAS